jgi:hypothetical protein
LAGRPARAGLLAQRSAHRLGKLGHVDRLDQTGG